MEMQKPDPIVELIGALSQELRQEIVINEDSTGFWLKAMNHIFENAVVSIRENVDALAEAVAGDPDLYNYMSAFVFRMFSQPFTREALDRFAKGFDEIAGDKFFRDGFGFNTSALTKVETFLLFITIHRNHIQIAFLEAQQFAEDKRAAEIAARRGGRNK